MGRAGLGGPGVAGRADRRSDRVAITKIKPGESPRDLPEDPTHIRLLAESMGNLPPILVRSADLSVVDGTHRLAAERLTGAATVRVIFFEGDDLESYIESIKCNVRHGKPLSMNERKRAAKRILDWDPTRSDRGIAEICGLSAKVVARLRATAANPRLNSVRVGKDGRKRPINSGALRETVANMLSEQPDLSLREVGRKAGVSVNTVRAVRSCLDERRESGGPSLRTNKGGGAKATSWRIDKAITSTSEGDAFSKWFEASSIDSSDWEGFVEHIPLSRVYEIGDEARHRAEQWACFARALAARTQSRKS